MTDAIKVEGLAEFSRNLKRLDSELPKVLRVAFNDSAQLVVDEAKPDVPRRSGKAAGSIKARSTRSEARVTEGGNRAPWMPWLDFGGRVGRRKSVKRPVLEKGRYLYPAYFSLRDSGKFQQVMTENLLSVAAAAGIEVE